MVTAGAGVMVLAQLAPVPWQPVTSSQEAVTEAQLVEASVTQRVSQVVKVLVAVQLELGS